MLTTIWKEIHKIKKTSGGSKVLVKVDNKNGTVNVVGLPVKLVIDGKTYTEKVRKDKTALFGSVQETGIAEITCADSTQNFYNAGTLEIIYYGAYEVIIDNANPYENWLLTAGYTINDYPEIADVLADAEALDRLFNIHNSVDKFIKWYNSDNAMLTQFVENENAMKAIGNNDYAADKLMAIPEVSEALLDSDYWEYILNAKVPTMTSNASPEGECSAVVGNFSGYEPYKAFDGDDTTAWASNTYQSDGLIYKFTVPTCVKKVEYLSNNTGNGVKQYVLYGSNDGITWTDLTGTVNVDDGAATEHTDNVNNDNFYLYYKMYVPYITATSGSNSQPWFNKLQFYGRQLKGLVPKMTSNTEPSGGCFESSHAEGTNNFEVWAAFDQVESTYWHASYTDAIATFPEWIGYKFNTPTRVETFSLLPYYDNSYGGCRLKTYKYQASNDGNDWVDLTEELVHANNAFTVINSVTKNIGEYLYYRIYVKDNHSEYSAAIIALQFYAPSYEERYTVVSGQFDYVAWLETAGLSGYADLDAVLADEKAVRTLMTKTASVDYMVEGLADTPDVASQILNDVYVVKWVNYREYAYSSLSAVEELKSIMDASGKYGTYISVEKAAGSKALVPMLTSNTSDSSCVLSASSQNGGSGNHYMYNVFDGEDNSSFWYATTKSNEWIAVEFAIPTIVNSFKLVPYLHGTANAVKNFKIQASNDGSEWVTLYTGLNEVSNSAVTIMDSIDNTVTYKYYRVYVDDAYSGPNCGITTLQFYGRQLNALIPTMTGDSSPSGVASGSSSATADKPWKAFDNNSSTYYSTTPNETTGNYYLKYDFGVANKVNVMRIVVNTGYISTKSYVLMLQGSNDDSDWVTISEEITAYTLGAKEYVVDVNSDVAYRYYRIVLNPDKCDASTTHVSNDYSFLIYELQFYGVEKWSPKGLVPVMTSNTAPYGEASASSNGSAYPVYKTFDGNGNTTNWASTGNTNEWIQYKFVNPACVKKVSVTNYTASSATIMASNDGSNWTTLGSISFSGTEGENKTVEIQNEDCYIYYRLGNMNGTGSNTVALFSLQFYGRQLEALVPPMTSDTAPVGEASASSVYNSAVIASSAFDGDELTWWSNSSGTSWLQYKFNIPECVTAMYIRSIRVPSATLQASNDGSNWTDLATIELDSSNNEIKKIVNFVNDKYFTYYRLGNMTATTGNLTVYTLQFYGAPDYDSRTYIYDHGVEVMEVGSEYVNYSASGVTKCNVEKQIDSILFPAKDTASTVLLGLKDSPIDLTSHKVLRARVCSGILVSSVMGTMAVYSAKDAISANRIGSSDFTQNNVPDNNVVDLNNINGSYYPVLNSGYQGRSMTITEWWLE